MPKIDPLNKKNYGAVISSLTVGDVKAAVSFYTRAFGFAKRGIMNGPNGKPVHAELTEQMPAAQRQNRQMRVPGLILSIVLSASITAAPAQTVLPAPTGLFRVGRQMILWNDPCRPEDVGPTAGKPREVAAYVFYPATTKGNRLEYYPGLTGLENAAETRVLRLQFGGAWSAVASGNILTNAYAEAAMPPGRAKFPVLIFSPGASAPVLAYQLQLEELASHGYVVFGLEHGTDSALIIRPDRTLLPYVTRRAADPGPPTVAGLESNRDQVIRRTSDIVFALSEINLLAKQPGSVFHNRLDLSRIGIFGHSEGGKCAIRACQIDPRVRACLNQDGEMFGIPFGSMEPIPSVLAGKSTIAPVAVIYVAEPDIPGAQLAAVNVTRKQFQDWRAAKNRALRGFLQENSRQSDLITITLAGYVHGTFMDIRLLGSNPSPQAVLNHSVGTNITLAFFDANLRWDHPKNWSRFAEAPGEGITVEKFGRKQ